MQEEHESHQQDETKAGNEHEVEAAWARYWDIGQERRYELGQDMLLDNDRTDMDYGMV